MAAPAAFNQRAAICAQEIQAKIEHELPRKIQQIVCDRPLTSDASTETIENYRSYYQLEAQHLAEAVEEEGGSLSPLEVELAFHPFLWTLLQKEKYQYSDETLSPYFQQDSDRYKTIQLYLSQGENQKTLQGKSHKIEAAIAMGMQIRTPAPKSIAFFEILRFCCRHGFIQKATELACQIPYYLQKQVALNHVLLVQIDQRNPEKDQETWIQIEIETVKRVALAYAALKSPLFKTIHIEFQKENPVSQVIEECSSDEEIYQFFEGAFKDDIYRLEILGKDLDQAQEKALQEQFPERQVVFLHAIFRQRLQNHQPDKAQEILDLPILINYPAIKNHFLLEICYYYLINYNDIEKALEIAASFQKGILQDCAFFYIGQQAAKSKQVGLAGQQIAKIQRAALKALLSEKVSFQYQNFAEEHMAKFQWGQARHWASEILTPSIKKAALEKLKGKPLDDESGCFFWLKQRLRQIFS